MAQGESGNVTRRALARAEVYILRLNTVEKRGRKGSLRPAPLDRSTR